MDENADVLRPPPFQSFAFAAERGFMSLVTNFRRACFVREKSSAVVRRSSL